MKLKELKSIIYSRHGDIQSCIIYDKNADIDLEYGCSVEYAYEHYGDREIDRVHTVLEHGCAYIIFSIK